MSDEFIRSQKRLWSLGFVNPFDGFLWLRIYAPELQSLRESADAARLLL